jgi:MFS transporter, DHA1 family, multidrug resistance protein
MTDAPQTVGPPGRGHRLGQGEFVAMMAVLFATIAFSIDAMLPALPEIAAELTPEAVNRAQLVLTTFVLGMGAGTLSPGRSRTRWGASPRSRASSGSTSWGR